MAQFAELLETAIANADSRDQLTASRARLLTAADDARRRVVRDLHDGAQQRLVHTHRDAEARSASAPRRAGERRESLVDEALEQARAGQRGAARAGARHPSRGPHARRPPAGVDAVVARLDLPVDVDVPAERFPAEIEASAYFIVAEALTNVVKHAHAERAEVRASVADGLLRVEVRDDGIGGADPRRSRAGRDGRSGDRARRAARRSRARPTAGRCVAATLPVSHWR